jgi:hypothetical protein
LSRSLHLDALQRALFVLEAASGVNAPSFETTMSSQSVFSPVVSRSRGASFVLEASDTAALAAGGSYAECAAVVSCATQIPLATM